MSKFKFLFCLFFILGSSFVLAQGLVTPAHYYNFEESSGDLLDQAGSNDGKIIRITNRSNAGINNLAYYCDGTDDVINFTFSGNYNSNPRTWNIWFKTTDNDNALKNLIGTRTDAYFSQFQLDHATNDQIAWYETNNVGGNDFGARFQNQWSNVSDGAWHMITMTKAPGLLGSGINIYVDGVNLTNNDNPWGNGVNNHSMVDYLLCAGNIAGTNAFQGYVDEISYFNIELTPSNISHIYSNNCFYQLNCGWGTETPSIDTSTYNLTSGYTNTSVWRQSNNSLVNTTDPTPTLTFEVDKSANCSISKYNLNYTQMILNDSNSKCASTETTSHTCTLPSSLILSANTSTLFVACASSTGGFENTTASSLGLAVYYNSPPYGLTLTPANASTITTTTATLDFPAKDNNSDMLRYYLYTNNTNSSSLSLIYNGTGKQYNLTVADGETWFWMVHVDDGQTNTSNSSINQFLVALTGSGTPSSGGGSISQDEFDELNSNPTCENLEDRLMFMIPSFLKQFSIEKGAVLFQLMFDWVVCEATQLGIVDVDLTGAEMVDVSI